MMLFHNVYDMSTTSTPTRVARGLLVPGIDTRSTLDKSATALAYAGLHTPPQSAHDSRRQSIAYPNPSDVPYSASSSMASFSQPPTPVHDMKHNMDPNSFTQSWSEGLVHTAQAPGACSIAPMPDTIYHSPFSQGALFDVSGAESLPSYSICQPTSNFDNFTVPVTMASPIRDGVPSTQPPGFLKADIFHSSYSLSQDARIHESFYAHTPPVHPMSGMPLMTGYGAGITSMPMFPAPQVVMPSQLNPHDDGFQQESFPSPTHRDQDMGLSRSFDSNSTNYTWDSGSPQSPDDAYFRPSDEEEYVEVKREEPFTPSRGSSVSYASAAGVSAHRSKRRSSRRGRRSHTSQRVWAECFKHNMLISYEGKPWTMDNNGQIITEETRDTKPHKCLHKDEHGKACGRRFERSEHLKRHMGMHTDERRFPCPLPGCGKKIGRPDNATDHFKTHLRPPSKGKRNKHCEMKYLEVCITDQYPEQQAAKLIANLKKWKAAEDEKVHAESARMDPHY